MSDKFHNQEEDIEIINIDGDEADDELGSESATKPGKDIDTEFYDDDDEVEEINYQEVYEELEERVERKAAPKKKRIFWIIAVVVVLVFVAAGIMYEILSPCKDYASITDYYAVESGVPIVLNGEITEGCIEKNGVMYLSKAFVDANLTDKFFYDGESLVTYTTATHLYDITMGTTAYFLDGEVALTEYECAIVENGIPYIAVEFLKDKTGFSYFELEAPQRLVIVADKTSYEVVSLGGSAIIRDSATIKGLIVEDSATRVEHELNIWYTVGTQGKWAELKNVDGRTGYVQMENIQEIYREVTYDSGYVAEEYTTQLRDYDIMLVWNAIYDMNDNNKIATLLEDTKGITTVSPTWYQLIDAEGNMNSFADWDYISYLHDMGMEIWPLISDFTSDDEEGGWDEKALFTKAESRRNLIANIMKEINTYGYDGINLDMETVPNDAGDAYIQFIRELSIECRKAGVVLSVDNYVPKEFNLYYNRTAQGECVDYVIVMGYDEHYSGAAEAGSVASADFVEEGIKETLKEVAKEKVINAVPFYTRMWREGFDEEGNEVFASTSYSMQGGVDIANELGLNIVWDDSVKQNVATGNVGTLYYSVWLEDEASMAARMEIIKGYDLAGIAAWQLGMEMDSVWDILLQ